MANSFKSGFKIFLLLIVSVFALSPAARAKFSYASSLVPMDSLNDWVIATAVLTAGYSLQFLSFGAFLEWTNPIPKTEKRMNEMKKQIKLGLMALLVIIVTTTLWFWLIEPHTPYYGYYETHEYTFTEFLKNVAIYMFVFDGYFYWTHRLLHNEWFMKTVHFHHHQFIEPTAFGQDAVHPFEAFLQGPLGHFLPGLIYPMHPVTITVIGFLTSIYALLAHDGRALDLNDHIKHHHYRNCNFAVYWGLWDYIGGTRYSTKKFPERYIPSWERAAVAKKN